MLVRSYNLAHKPDNRHSSGCYAALDRRTFLKMNCKERMTPLRSNPSSKESVSPIFKIQFDFQQQALV
jgi:hypothetical protein